MPRGDDPQSQSGKVIAERQYTGLADLNLVTRIFRVNPAFVERSEVRFARHVDIRDLKTRNVILLGSPRGNPWAELFEPRLTFLARYDVQTGVFFESGVEWPDFDVPELDFAAAGVVL